MPAFDASVGVFPEDMPARQHRPIFSSSGRASAALVCASPIISSKGAQPAMRWQLRKPAKPSLPREWQRNKTADL